MNWWKTTDAAPALEQLEERRLLATATWTGAAGNGLWHTPTNWDTGAVPTITEDVVIPDMPGTATITYNATSGSRSVASITAAELVQVTGGTLTVAGASSFNGAFRLSSNGQVTFGGTTSISALTMTGGRLGGTGNVTVNSTATLNNTSFTTRILEGSGELIFAPGSLVTMENAAEVRKIVRNQGTVNNTRDLNFFNGTLYNEGTWRQHGHVQGSNITASSGTTNLILNTGTFEYTDGGSASVAPPFTNASSGTATVTSGTLSLTGGGTNQGIINVSSGTSLSLGGSFAHPAGSEITGPGSISFQTGTHSFYGTIGTGTTVNVGTNQPVTVNFETPQSISVLNVRGILGGSANVTVTGSGSMINSPGLSSRFEGSGELIFAPGSLISMQPSPEIRRIVRNQGTIDSTRDFNFYNGTVYNEGTWRQHYHVQGSNITASSGTTNLISNSGTFEYAGGGSTTIAPAFTNTSAGMISVTSGTLMLSGGGANNGLLNAESGATLALNSAFTHPTGSQVTGSGTLTFQSGAHDFYGSVGSMLSVVVGTGFSVTVNFETPQTLRSLNLRANLGGSAHVSITEAATFQSGASTSLDGTGELIFSPGSQVTIDANSARISKIIRNRGTVNHSRDLNFANGKLYNEGTWRQHYHIQGSNITATVGTTNLISNSGTYEYTDGGSASISVPFSNSGMLVIRNGTLNMVNAGALIAPATVIAGTLQTGGISMGTNQFIDVQSGSVLEVAGHLLGVTTQKDLHQANGTVRFTGGTSTTPRQLEVFSADRGSGPTGYARNFLYNRIEIASGRTKLVDLSDNTAGSGFEAIYVDSLSVAAGATLDLNGLHLYCRASTIAGSVINGTINAAPDGGALPEAASSTGRISAPGESDLWTTYAYSGDYLSVTLAPSSGTLAPAIGYVAVDIIAPSGAVIATADNALSGSGTSVPISGLALTETGTYTMRVRAPISFPSNVGYYSITQWVGSLDIAPLPATGNAIGSIEEAYAIDQWTFTADANSQVQFDLGSTTSTGLLFTLTGPNGYVGFTNINADSGLLTLPVAGTYTLTARGSAAATGAYSFSMHHTTPIDVSPSTTYSGSDDTVSPFYKLFSVHVIEPSPLQIRFSESDFGDHNTLYVNFGAPPTLLDFDYQQTAVNGEAAITIPMATTGEWFVLLDKSYNPTSFPLSYTLSFIDSTFVISDATPDEVGSAGGPVAMTVTGSGFAAGMQAMLVPHSGGTSVLASDVRIDSFTSLTATFDLTLYPSDEIFDLVLTLNTQTQTLHDALHFAPDARGELTVDLISPDYLGYHQPSTLYVDYSNTGNAPMRAPLLIVNSTDLSEAPPALTLDADTAAIGYWTDFNTMPDGFSSSVSFLAQGARPGWLDPGESARVPVYYAGLVRYWLTSTNAISLRVLKIEADNSDLIDWNLLKDSLQPAGTREEAWDSMFPIITSNVGSTWGDYLTTLSRNAEYLTTLGESVYDARQLWNFEILKARGLGAPSALARATDASVITPGIPLSISRSYGHDPNQRMGMSYFGRGWNSMFDLRLEEDDDGNLSIFDTMTGAVRRFQPDSRYPGSYLASSDRDFGTIIDNGPFALDYQITEANGTVIRFNANGYPSQVLDANNSGFEIAWDASFNPTQVVHTSGAAISVFVIAGRVRTLIDSAGRVTVLSYDPTDEYLTSVTYPDTTSISYTYNSGGIGLSSHALRSITSGGVTQHLDYDSLGRLTAAYQDGNTSRVDLAYEGNGIVAVTPTLEGTTRAYFNQRGSIAKVLDPFDSITQVLYTDSGLPAQIIDPEGRSVHFTWSGSSNQPSTVTDQLGNVTKLFYGALDQLSTFRDALNRDTAFAYDSHGNLLTTTYADNTAERYTSYGSAGLPGMYRNRRGQQVDLTWNSAGQLTSRSVSGSLTHLYSYDAKGRLTTTTDGVNTTNYTYDAVTGWLTGVSLPGGRSIQYGYDSSGRRTLLRMHDGFETRYTYDALGRLYELRNAANELLIRYNYDAAGRVHRKDHANGTYVSYSFDAAGRVSAIQQFSAIGTVQVYRGYTYDTRGRISQMSSNHGTWTYQYDDAGQLTRAMLDSTDPSIADQDLSYSYDEVGNRVQTVENGVTTTYVANTVNQYTQVGSDSLQYDADGNLIRWSHADGTTTRYEFNELGQLVSVSEGDSEWEITYDTLGNRATVGDGSTTAAEVRDVVSPLARLGVYSSSGVVSHYSHGRGQEYGETGGISTFFAADITGTFMGLSAADGTTTASMLAPFGAALTTDTGYGLAGAFGSTAGVSSLQHAGARWFSERLGRFVSVDPTGLWGGDGNVYRYGHNNPVSNIDPDGLKSVSIGGTLIYGLGVWGEASVAFDGPRSSASFSGGLGTGIALGAGWSVGTSQPSDTGIAFVPYKSGFSTPAFSVGTTMGSDGRIDYDAGPVSPEVGIWLGNGAQISFGVVDKFHGIIDYFDYNSYVLSPEEACLAFASPEDCGITTADVADSSTARAIDPNHLYGPAGYGAQNFVRGDSLLSYRVEFENYGPGSVNEDGTAVSSDRWATAPAQQVQIRNSLSSDLDWSTFELTGFGFGDVFVTIPSGRQQYATSIEMTYGGVTFKVQFDARINLSTGEINVIFMSLDLVTGLPPQVLVGFLPPEDGTRRGMGYVTYNVRPDAGLPTGREIRNIALISFDGQLDIATNQIDPLNPALGTDSSKEARVTIDAGLPSSLIAPLPAQEASRSFTVAWSGTDDATGSGVVSYDIYVSVNEGPFMAWLLETPLTSAVFEGTWGNTYSFYAVARDGAGNVEPAPTSADTSTTLGLSGVSYWDGEAGDGAWANPLNWLADTLPADDTDVVIDVAGDAPVAFNAGSIRLHSLRSFEPFSVLGGQIRLSTSSLFDDNVTIAGGSMLVDASVSVGGTLTNNALLDLAASARVTVNGNFVQGTTGTFRTSLSDSTPQNYGSIAASGAVSLAGALEVRVPWSSISRPLSFGIIQGATVNGQFNSASILSDGRKQRIGLTTRYWGNTCTLDLMPETPRIEASVE